MRGMIDRRAWMASVAAFTASLALPRSVFAAAAPAEGSLRVLRIVDERSAELQAGAMRAVVGVGQRFGNWTLMEILAPETAEVVVEDFRQPDGPMLFVDAGGITARWDKTAEFAPVQSPQTCLGHSTAEVMASARDLLGDQLLATPGDPLYDTVAGVFPPIRKVAGDVFSFVGTPDTLDKIGFTWGGRTANFDPAVYQPSIEQLRTDGRVGHGLLGGYLPVMRFVYPEGVGQWTEMLAFAPFRLVNDNLHFQPVWYRVCRVEDNELQWSKYVDSYHPTPPQQAAEPRRYYADLADLKRRWDRILEPGMVIEVPDARVMHMAKFSLVRAMMTRQAGFPKYGVVDKNYGNTEHDGFQDTFTVETEALLEWGLIERAGACIENYFGSFVRDDGTILYRGPETGQFGRMLTVVAKYAEADGDPRLLLRHRARIDAVAGNLLQLRAKALALPAGDPAYGMISGWSEADSCLEKDPSRYVQPYFSNSAEAVRGFRDLGLAWASIGKEQADGGLVQWGEQLQREAAALAQDLAAALQRSELRLDGESIIPAIAGVKEPEHIVVPRDNSDPQYRGYRAYSELMHSGMLTAEQIGRIADYRNDHYDVLLRVPTAYAYNTKEMAGFLAYGHGYGLIQAGRIREALLLAYSIMAHQNTRGMWLAPETRKPMSSDEAAPYCSPAQLTMPLLWRWLLVFEDPQQDVLWLGKGVPRDWLAAGGKVAVDRAPTRWGRVAFSLASFARPARIEAVLRTAEPGLECRVNLCLRLPGQAQLKAVTLNGSRWRHFDAAAGVISLPAGASGETRILARY